MRPFFSKFSAATLTVIIAAGFIQPLNTSLSGGLLAQRAKVRVETAVPPREQQPDDTWTLVAVGDIMLSRFVATMIERKQDPAFPFHNTAPFLQDGDITFANLEGPFAPEKALPAANLIFKADPALAPVLKQAGFDVLSLANNHMSDAHEWNLLNTRTILSDAGIAHTGAGANENEARTPAFMDVRGKRIAFLAYGDPRFKSQVRMATATTAGIAQAGSDIMKADIAAAKANADVVIVSLHAGGEYRQEPDFTQRTFAQAAIDGGADLVIGHHPHWLQPLERYNGKVIAYSLGNFIFDQDWSKETSQGVIMKFTFDGNELINITATPIIIDSTTQPRVASDEEAKPIMERLGIEKVMSNESVE